MLFLRVSSAGCISCCVQWSYLQHLCTVVYTYTHLVTPVCSLMQKKIPQYSLGMSMMEAGAALENSSLFG